MSPDSPFPARAEAQPALTVASVSVVERTPAAQVSSGYTFYEFFAGGAMARIGLGPSWSCLLANDNHYGKARSYAANFGRAGLVVGDIARLTVADLPGRAALAWMSFPCVDLSEAGQRKGLEGWRSNAVWPCLKLMQGLRVEGRAPRLIVLENVTGLLELGHAEFFATICDTLAGAGYRCGVVMVDGALFVPQSRKRVFVIAVDEAIDIPPEIVAARPSLPFHTSPLIAACKRQKAQQLWWRLPTPPARTATFADLLESAPQGVDWFTRAETERLIGMMSPINLAKLDAAKRAGKRMVGGFSKRMRDEADGRVQRVEIRFDDVAGCLRMGSGGGSSIQPIMVVDGDAVSARRLSSRECARLMGLPDTYVLPGDYVEAYDLMGDGVVAPVVRYLAEHILEPLTA